MTASSFHGALQQTYAEQSIFGLQLLDEKLRLQFIDTVDAGILAYSQLQNLTEMADQHRDMLKKTWRSIASCADSREKCEQRECRCSYADYLCYRGLRDAQHRLEQQFDQLARTCYELRAVWQYVLRPVAYRMLRDEKYRRLFLWTLHMAGDLSTEELEVAEMPGCLKVRLLPTAIELTLGSEEPRIKRLAVIQEPVYPRR